MKRYIKKPYVYLFMLGAILLGGFQNCTRTQFDIVSKVETKSVDSSAVYSLDVSQNESLTDEVVYVALVVDNSESMKASVERLSRNIDSVLNTVKHLNAKVRIITTDEVSKRSYALERVVYDPNIPGKVIQKISKQQKLADQKIYTYSKQNNDSDLVSAQIKEAILKIPLDGASSERPMLSLATAIELDDFIPAPGSPVLVYVITDEDSDDSIHEFFNPLVNSADLEKASTMMIPRRYLYKLEQTHEKGVSSRLLGFASLEVCKSSVAYYTKLPNHRILQDCYVEEKPIRTTIEGYLCSELAAANSSGKLDAKSSAIFQNMYDCKDAETWNRSPEATSQAKSVLGDGILFGANKIKRFVPAIKTYLDQKLGSKYIMAVSANLPGQSCQLNGFQSYANLFISLQKLYSPEQFSISSICEEKDISSQLDKIAKQFETVIGREYKIDLAENETISKLLIVGASGDKKEIDKSLYSLVKNAKGDLVMKLDNSVELASSDRFELAIIKKVDEVVKEVQ